ncbi:hypothetical protein Ddye_025218 [Dipteronia dyeriana]|uniref:Uncharacterized protein n=1 Tax=Dipteronia dyeriana TaxID=168575 RepID=A0AAD9WV70_9ROSI|nr:hypothetical protein Ddye_025218 [Dipteronia dyeriana]
MYKTRPHEFIVYHQKTKSKIKIFLNNQSNCNTIFSSLDKNYSKPNFRIYEIIIYSNIPTPFSYHIQTHVNYNNLLPQISEGCHILDFGDAAAQFDCELVDAAATAVLGLCFSCFIT